MESEVLFAAGMPLPRVDAHSRPFWEGCRERRLRVQRCAECGLHRHPPRPLCPRCGAFACAWSDSAGRGRVFTYTIVHHTPHPVASASLPYAVAVIELADCDAVLVVSNVVGCAPTSLRVGLPVRVAWEERPDGQTLPRFRPEGA